MLYYQEFKLGLWRNWSTRALDWEVHGSLGFRSTSVIMENISTNLALAVREEFRVSEVVSLSLLSTALDCRRCHRANRSGFSLWVSSFHSRLCIPGRVIISFLKISASLFPLFLTTKGGGKRRWSLQIISFIEVIRMSLHISLHLFHVAEMWSQNIVYGLCLTILETKMENFKNSVKTLNENSQAVQTKTSSLRAFWRILIKENTILHCRADVSENNGGSVVWEIVDW